MHRRSKNGKTGHSTPTRVPLTVRLPEKIVQQIDAELDQRDVPLSRNNWLLEAALEKLQRNATGGSDGAQ